MRTGTVTSADANANLAEINAGLSGGKEYTMPARNQRVEVAGPPVMTAGCKFNVNGCTVVNKSAGPAVKCFAPGMGYTQPTDVAFPVVADDWVYAFMYGQHDVQPRSRLVRVTSVGGPSPTPGGYGFTTSPAINPGESVLRFKKCWPCGALAANSDRCVITSGVTFNPADVPAGMWLYVTDGPSADAGRGEYVRVASVASRTVYFDRPLLQSYNALGAVADTAALSDVTVRDLRGEALPNGNPVTWAAGFKGCPGLVLENVWFNGACDIISSSHVHVTKATGGPVQLNGVVKCDIAESYFASLYAEEECSRVTVTGTDLGFGRHPDANVLTAWFRTGRFTLSGVRIVNPGKTTWPPANAVTLGGDDNRIAGVEITGTHSENYNGWSSFSGNRLFVTGYVTDGNFEFQRGTGVSLSLLRGPYFQLQANDGSGNVVSDAKNIQAGVGWLTGSNVEFWRPKSIEMHAPQPPKTETFLECRGRNKVPQVGRHR